MIFVADAHRGDGKRVVVRADEKLAAFLELESVIRTYGESSRQAGGIFRNSPDMKTRIPPVLITFALVCFVLVENTQAVSPPPDGGYPGGNTAEGQNALLSLNGGGYNTAVGFFSLRSNATNNFNTAIGAGALLANTADLNTATGAAALLSNTTGFLNTANGAFALFSNTTGNSNTATGVYALTNNTTGVGNTSVGYHALPANTTGSSNTAIGDHALFFNNADRNTATGSQALEGNTTGYENTADGYQALLNNTGAGNTAVGYLAGSNLTTGNDNIDIGSDGVAGDAGIIRIGRSFIGATYIAGIFAVSIAGAPVQVDGNGQLGTAPSSARFKDEIKPMDKTSEAILALKPVTFRYKKEIDRTRISQYGLVAEEVEKVNPDLVVRDKEGKPYSVRYEQINAMLLNEFLKEHRRVQELESTVAKQEAVAAKQEASIAKQQKQIETLTAGLQKVSAQLEASKTAPQLVNNSP